jgi:hypothetical protein
MKAKRVCLLLSLSLFIINCAKKGPPTSPDRTPPLLLSVEVVDRNHIEVAFDEDIEAQPAESLSNLIIDGLHILASVSAGKKIILTTDDMDTVDYKIRLLNIRDLSGNGKDEYKTKFRGTLKEDTTPPSIVRSPSMVVRNTPTDTNFTMKFTEPIENFRIYIMPETKIKYNWNEIKNEIKLEITAIDTLTVYHLYGVFWDRARNYKEVDINFTREKNLPLIWLKGTVEDSTILLMTQNGRLSQFTISDSTGNFIFQNLYPGDCVLFGKSRGAYFSSDTFALSLPKEEVELYPINEKEMDKKMLETLNSLYEVYLGDFK